MVTWPSNTKEIIDQIRDTIGRPIELFTSLPGEDCPLCEIDPLSGKSVDPFCPVCSGQGQQITWSGTTITAHVRWGQVDASLLYPGARIITGDCTAAIEYTAENVAIIDAAKYALIDGKVLYIDSYDLRGVQPVNRVVLNLVQNPRDKK